MSYIKDISLNTGKKLIKRVVRRPLKRLIKRAVRALRDRVLFEYRLRKHTPVLIYQMGKVASKSVFNSLLSQYPGVVCHAHRFSSEHTKWTIRRLYYWVMECKRPLNIISLTREPIGRNISAFFQNFERITAVPYHKANFSLEELKSIFMTKFNQEKALRWFDEHIKKNLGIDVYANSFPKCGYATYCRKNIRLLVMRSEMKDFEKVEVIRVFLNLNSFHLINTNISEEKEYALTYKDFKNNVTFPKAYIDMMCESRYFNYFYEQDVIKAVKKKWSED